MAPALPIVASAKAIAFVVFPIVGSVLLAYGVYQLIMETRRGQRKRVTDRLRDGQAARTEKVTASILRRRAGEDAHVLFGSLVSKLSITPKLQMLLDQANVDWSAQKMLVNQVATALLAFFGILIFAGNALTAAIAGAAVLGCPPLWLKLRRSGRMKRLTNQLPEVFEMMSQALRAGHSLASSIEVVHQQMPDPIGSEFGRVFHEQNLGITVEDALKAMADRVDSLDVRFFVTAVLIQRQTGGDLAEVLDKIGTVIRQRIELFGLVRGLTAEGRLSGWVLFALPIVTFMASCYLNPDYANVLLTDPRGKLMLVIAAGMQIMGLAMIRWIVNIKV